METLLLNSMIFTDRLRQLKPITKGHHEYEGRLDLDLPYVWDLRSDRSKSVKILGQQLGEDCMFRWAANWVMG